MMNRDRGTIKWNAMMLPEHVKYLREWQAEDNVDQRPEIDEWTLQEFAELLQQAYEHQLFVVLTVWAQPKIIKVSGYIKQYNSAKLSFLINEETILCENICGVQLVE